MKQGSNKMRGFHAPAAIVIASLFTIAAGVAVAWVILIIDLFTNI